jgi:hypothetical protein
LITPYYQGGVHFQPPAPVQDSPADDSRLGTSGRDWHGTAAEPRLQLRRG